MKTQHDYWKEDHDRVMAEMAAKMNYIIHETRDNEHFKYSVQILGGMVNFHNTRVWVTQTYGLGSDISKDEPIVNKHWAFFIKYRHYIIYLKGDEELSWFKIRHGNPV
jgi:hypothetical protein